MDIELTKENLEYVAFVARKYCNLYDAGWEDAVVENALDLFCRRVNNIKCSTKYDLYKSNQDLQTKIQKYGYDTNGFWLLLLFLYDFTESCFGANYIFDKVSVGESIDRMLTMLDANNCEMTISNGVESAHMSTWLIKDGLKALLSSTKPDADKYYPFVKTTEDNVLWHKIKFFMEMLDYFLTSHTPNSLRANTGRKDWLFVAQALFLVGYLSDEKYFKGYERVKHTKNDLDGNSTETEDLMPLKGLGKFLTDNTKLCKDSANRQKSNYCYNSAFDLVD